MKESVVVDSSVWIEIFGKLKKAHVCLIEIKNYSEIIVPTIVIYEVQVRQAKRRISCG